MQLPECTLQILRKTSVREFGPCKLVFAKEEKKNSNCDAGDSDGLSE
jgi:hypothetical protein